LELFDVFRKDLNILGILNLPAMLETSTTTIPAAGNVDHGRFQDHAGNVDQHT
jgi:hypothetical protein